MNWTGGRRATLCGVTAVLGVGLALGAVIAAPARASDDLEKYAGDKKEVAVTPGRTYSQADDRTTFTFTLATKDNQAVSHVILLACKEIPIVSASGPDGPAASTEPKQDPAIKESGHEGIKFDPGKAGTYTIVFAGDILGAEFVVKDG